MSEQEFNSNTLAAARDLQVFVRDFIAPFADEWMRELDSDQLSLSKTAAATLLTSAVIDYVRDLRQAHRGGKRPFTDVIAKELDEYFGVQGSFRVNFKYRLVHAMANSIKHRKLDGSLAQNREVVEVFGDLRFDTLHLSDGIVWFESASHRFDFGRVVLAKSLEALSSWSDQDAEDWADLLLNDPPVLDHGEAVDLDDDPSLAIDALIADCNPQCIDCSLLSDDCRCSEFKYGDELGEFTADRDPNFDFDQTMSRSSGAYKPDKN